MRVQNGPFFVSVRTIKYNLEFHYKSHMFYSDETKSNHNKLLFSECNLEGSFEGFER